MKNVVLLFLVIIASGCGEPDVLSYHVTCDSCRARYSVGDSVMTKHVVKEWHTSFTVYEGQLYGIHVDSIESVGAARAFVSLGGDIKWVDVCSFNENCDLNHVDQVKLPWWAK